MADYQQQHTFACEAISKKYRDRGIWKDAPTLSCVGCGKPFRPKRTDRLKYCSRECSFKNIQQWRFKKPKAPPKAPRGSVVTLCKVCERPFEAKHNNKYCSSDCRAAPKAPVQVSVNCLCGNTFIRISGTRKRYCSEECRERQLRITVRKTRKSYKLRYGRKWRKRARLLGVEYEPVNSMLVFARDGWRCQICGCKTPKRIKGTAKHNAPTLDHRIPITKGGSHTYSNVQCACRRCNTNKGNKSNLGQLPLFGHSDYTLNINGLGGGSSLMG